MILSSTRDFQCLKCSATQKRLGTTALGPFKSFDLVEKFVKYSYFRFCEFRPSLPTLIEWALIKFNKLSRHNKTVKFK
jgi:hypothetical protein